MAGLISDQLINNLRTVAYRQLITPIEIWRYAPVDGPYGANQVWTKVTDTMAWVVPKFKAEYKLQPGGYQGAPNAAEIRIRFGTDVHIGDRIKIMGEDWEVNDTNEEASIILYLKAWAERVQ